MSQYGYLEHHGIKGQRWGTRNGPPYPLSYQAHDQRERRANPTSRLDNYGYGRKPDFSHYNSSDKINKRALVKQAGHQIKEAAKYVNPVNRTKQNIKSGIIKTGQFINNESTGRIKYLTRKKNSDWTRDNNGGDIQIKKGQKAYRIVTNKDEKLKDKPRMYATINEEDRNLFRGTFRTNTNKGKDYEKEMTFNRDIKVASKESQVESLMRVTGKSREEALQILGKHNTQLVLDDINRSKETDDMIKDLKKRGYDAVLDLNDSGWLGKSPVVLLNPDEYLTEDKITKLTDYEKRKALDQIKLKPVVKGIKEDTKNIISNKIKNAKDLKNNPKEYIGNEIGHYTRNLNNTNLPKNDKDAAKKGWRKLSSKESAMHQFSQKDGVENSKWVSPDGHKEVVFTGKGRNQRITQDVRDEGTYNYYDPQNNPFKHTVYDVIPYILLGNESNDPTTAVSRVAKSIENFLKKNPEAADSPKEKELVRKLKSSGSDEQKLEALKDFYQNKSDKTELDKKTASAINKINSNKKKDNLDKVSKSKDLGEQFKRYFAVKRRVNKDGNMSVKEYYEKRGWGDQYERDRLAYEIHKKDLNTVVPLGLIYGPRVATNFTTTVLRNKDDYEKWKSETERIVNQFSLDEQKKKKKDLV